MPVKVKEDPAPSVVMDMGDMLTIQELQNKLEPIQQNRQAIEKQWYKNIAYLYGHQHFRISRTGKTLREKLWFAFEKQEQTKKERRSSNRILFYYRSLLSRMLKMKSITNVEPLTREKRDVTAAKVAKEVLEDFWINVNRGNPYLSEHLSGMLLCQKYLYQYLLVMSKGYLNPEFNPKTKTRVLSNGKIVMEEAGEIECNVLPPLFCYRDPLGRFYFEKKIMSLEEIHQRYDVDVQKEEISVPDIEKQMLSLLDKTDLAKLDNAATVWKYTQLPDKDHSKGRRVIYTAKDMILDEDMPEEFEGRLPYFEFTWFDLLLSPMMQQSFVEQLMDSQDEYNFTVSRIAEYKKYLAGKVFVPDGANLQTKWNDMIGQIIKYTRGQKPDMAAAPPVPEHFFKDLKRIDSEMQDIAMAHDPTTGQVPAGVKSGIGLQVLQEKDDATLSPTTMEFEEKLGHFADFVLKLVSHKYTEERILHIVDDKPSAAQRDVKTFLGHEVDGNRRIKIIMGSALPQSLSARQQTLIDLIGAKIISPEEAKRYLELGNVEGALDNIDERLAKYHIDLLLKGERPEPQEWYDNRVFTKIFREFMTEPEFQDLTIDQQDSIIAYYRLVEQRLGEELKAIQSAGKPPAGPAQ